MAWRCGDASPSTQWSGWFAPVSPSTSARAAMPCRNSSGKVASEASSTPSAPSPLQVKATVTQRLSGGCDSERDVPRPTVSSNPASHWRPDDASRKLRKT